MDAARTCPPYGIYLLATLLRELGHETTVVDLIAQGSSDLRPHFMTLAAADLIGIGTSSLSWPTARDCIATIRSAFSSVPIVLGGIHATMFDRHLLTTTGAGFAIRGEAEVALPALCDALRGKGRLPDVPNLTYKTLSGRIHRNPAATMLPAETLARYSPPDYSGIPRGRYFGLGVESSRGCAFDCCFCSTSYRRSWRSLPADTVVGRIEKAMSFGPLTSGDVVQIVDDEFTTQPERVGRICALLRERRMRPRLVFDARVNDLLDPAFVETIAPFAHQFLVGAECGYDRGLEMVGKKTDCRRMTLAARNLHEHGIADRADFSFVLGFPWETKADVMATVRFAHDLHSRFSIRILLQWYCQIPGSRLWSEQREREIVHEAHYDDYGFFRNHYLFRTGVSLKPSEVFDVQSIVESLKAGSGRARNGMSMVECSVPEPIITNYPRETGDNSALANLREVVGT
jgi:anaerobic magnesium-protoporphyrin IX monomethyl ester cyclase